MGCSSAPTSMEMITDPCATMAARRDRRISCPPTSLVRQLENMSHFEAEFNMIRAEHEHYRQKVDDLKAWVRPASWVHSSFV